MSKKIIITEAQMKLIKEAQSIDIYVNKMKEIEDRVDFIYHTLLHSNIGNYLGNEINLYDLSTELHNLDTQTHQINQVAYDKINSLNDNEYDNDDHKIDNAKSIIDKKIIKLQDLIKLLQEIANMETNNNTGIAKLFAEKEDTNL